MQEADIGVLLRDALMLALKLGGPPLIAALAVGLVMSLIQAVTQVNEPTLAFVPKALTVCGVLVILGPFLRVSLTDFAHMLFDRLVSIGGS